MDVEQWLRGLGLERYASVFSDAELTAGNLADLTDADLKEIGLPLGPRKTVLKAIEELGAAPATLGSPPLASAPERRQLTVMFVDLVGSTALSARLDPEEMGAVLRGYQNAVAGEIARFEGHVAKFMGDGVLAYFGWPRAHEDEAERAVRAGLAVRDAVARLTADGAPLACRVGIATGLVVVGELIGEGSASEQTVVGDTPNLAARLQALAEPGQVVIGETTRRLVGGLFELTGLGAHTVKGIDRPVAAFAVTGARQVRSRFEAKGDRFQPMVGRDQELALLMERWALAQAGEGQGVLLVGEAGIGKSRIVRALLDGAGAEPRTRIRYQCSPYHGDSALWPVIQQLGHAAGLAATDTTDAKLDKLEALATDADTAALLAELLGIDGAARYGRPDMSPEDRRKHTLEALVRELAGLAARQPVLMLLEDAHWIDPTTQELLELCLDAVVGARVLIVVTTRPEQQPALVRHPHITRLRLNRLSRAGAEAIIARVAGEPLPTAVVDTIIARTDGVPLYVEELTKAVLGSCDTTIPASLHDSLIARLDRVPEIKEVAQVAACIGREFDYQLLATVAGRPEAALNDALDGLAAAELVYCRGTPPDARYTFKHALVCDAAHESLLRSRRAEIHAHLAAVLEAEARGGVDVEPEMLARHHEAGGDIERAVRYWKLAGDRARARYANREASVSYAKGLRLLAQLPSMGERDRLELDLRVAASRPILVGEGYTSDALEQNASRVATLARVSGDDNTLWRALYDLGRFCNQRVNLTGAEAANAETLGLEIVEIGERLGDKCAITAGCYTLVANKLLTADFIGAKRLCARSAALGVSAQEQLDISDNFQAAIGCSTINAILHWHLGYPWQARSMSTSALQQAKEMDRPFTLAFTFQRAAVLWHLERSPAQALQAVDQFLAVHEEFPAPHWLPWVQIIRAWSHMAEHRLEDALADLDRAWPLWHDRGGSEFLGPYFRCISAEVSLAAHQLDRATSFLEEAFALRGSTLQSHWDAELRRVLAALSFARGRASEEVEGDLHTALAIAQEQSARSLELRAARDLARLWAERGERQRARDLLAPIYGWFTEGFDTPDLVEAKALLDEL